jgi:hypothetical protein
MVVHPPTPDARQVQRLTHIPLTCPSRDPEYVSANATFYQELFQGYEVRDLTSHLQLRLTGIPST